MSKKRYTVACLSGDGIGPEVMAEASRALADVSQLHGFGIDEHHVDFVPSAEVERPNPFDPLDV